MIPEIDWSDLDPDVIPKDEVWQKEGWVRPTFRPLANPDLLWGMKAGSESELSDNAHEVSNDLVRLGMSEQLLSMMWGSVGVGKTERIRQMARETDENGVPYQVIVLQPSTEDPTVIHGMQFTAQETRDGELRTIMRRSMPQIVEMILDYWIDHGGLTILFLDELTTCAPAQQAAMLGIMTHGEFGGSSIMPFTAQVGAGNPPRTVSATIPLSEAAINRAFHVPIFTTVDSYLEGWRGGWGDESKAPTGQEYWYIEQLLNQNRQGAFRNGRWEPEDLVPFERMEHSPRVVTDYARLLRVINRTFATAPVEVRRHYLVEAARAYMGSEWAENMGVVLQSEQTSVSWDTLYERVLDGKVSWEDTSDDVSQATDTKALFTDAIGGDMSVEQSLVILDTARDLVRSDLRQGKSSVAGFKAVVLLWASIEFAPKKSWRAQLYRYGKPLLEWSRIPDREHGGSGIPKWVGSEARESVRDALQAKKTSG